MATGTDRTIRLHRVLPAKPEKVYKAFVDADAKAQWLPPNGFTCKVHHLDPRVGGTYRMSFTNFSTGNGHSFGGEYRELIPNERIHYTDRFDDPSLPEPLPIALFGNDEDGYRVAWRRPQRRDDFGPAVRSSRRDYAASEQGGFGGSTAGNDGELMSDQPVDDDVPF